METMDDSKTHSVD
jgi:hypothetical protein